MKNKLSLLIVSLLLVTVVGCDGSSDVSDDGAMMSRDGGTADGSMIKADGAVPVASCVGAITGTPCGVPSCTTLAANEGAYAYETSYVVSYGMCLSDACVQRKQALCGDTLHHPCEVTPTGALCQ